MVQKDAFTAPQIRKQRIMLKLIKSFVFTNSERENIGFSDPLKIRLVPNENVIQLRRNAAGEFPTEADQQRERECLFRLIEKLVKWENINNE